MADMGNRAVPCPCCKECAECKTGFLKVVDMKNTGIVIYRYSTEAENVNIQINTKNTVEDVFHGTLILHNTKEVDLSSIDYLPEIEEKTSCERCRGIIEHAHRLLQKVPTINKNDIIGICDHCKLKNQSCDDCRMRVKKFFVTRNETKEIKERIRDWLSKVTDSLKDAKKGKDSKLPKKHVMQAHSELKIDQLCSQRLSEDERKIEIKDLFHTDAHRVGLSKTCCLITERDKRTDLNIAYPHFETSDQPVVFLDTSGKESQLTIQKGKEIVFSADDAQFHISDLDFTQTMLLPSFAKEHDNTRQKKKKKVVLKYILPVPVQSEKDYVMTREESFIKDDKIADKSCLKTGRYDVIHESTKNKVESRGHYEHSSILPGDQKKYRHTKEKYLINDKKFDQQYVQGMEKDVSIDKEAFEEQYVQGKEGDERISQKLLDKQYIQDISKYRQQLDERYIKYDSKIEYYVKRDQKPFNVQGQSEEAPFTDAANEKADMLQKQFSFSFPYEVTVPTRLNREKSSSELIKDIQDMLYVRAEKHSKRLEEECKRKVEEEEKERLALADKQKLAAEKKEVAEEKKKADADNKLRKEIELKPRQEKKVMKQREKEKKAMPPTDNGKSKSKEPEPNVLKSKLELKGPKSEPKVSKPKFDSKELKSKPEPKDSKPKSEPKQSKPKLESKEPKSELKELKPKPEPKELTPNPEPKEPILEVKELKAKPKPKGSQPTSEPKPKTQQKEPKPELKESNLKSKQIEIEIKDPTPKPGPKEPKFESKKSNLDPKGTKLKSKLDNQVSQVDKEVLKAEKEAEREIKELEKREREKNIKKDKEEKERLVREKKEQLQNENEVAQKQKDSERKQKDDIKQENQEKTLTKQRDLNLGTKPYIESKLTKDIPKKTLQTKDQEKDKSRPDETQNTKEKPPKTKELNIDQIKLRKPSIGDSILQLVKIKQDGPHKAVKPKRLSEIMTPLQIAEHKLCHKNEKGEKCPMCMNSDLEIDFDTKKPKDDELTDIIIGQRVCKYMPPLAEKIEAQVAPLFLQSKFDRFIDPVIKAAALEPSRTEDTKVSPHPGKQPKSMAEQDAPKGVIRYALSDRTFIEKGWTMLPTEKVVRKMNVYRMRPAHPEFDWFKHNKNKRLMEYDTGERLAEFDDNGRGRWYYRNGRLALDYYDAEELNAQQRFVIYSSGEPDQRGRSHPYTILATFDYLGNGIVFDYSGKIRLKYNQTEGVVLDRTIGPVSHWKWHTLNDPPVLQQVMIDTQMAHKDPEIFKMGGPRDNKTRPDNEEMLSIEFDNFIKEKSKKLSQSFKPFQIKMKALKINENFSLKVLDQATVYLIFRDGMTNLKLNIGMILDHKEIVDTDTAEVGEVSNNLERFPGRTDSLAELQKSVAHAQRFERTRSDRERRLRPLEPCDSADKLTAGTSRPMRFPFRTVPSGFTTTAKVAGDCHCKCTRKPSTSNIYYDNRLF